MIKRTAIFTLLLISNISFGQKEDNVWVLGGNYDSPDSTSQTCIINFTNDFPTITYLNKKLPFVRTNASICNSAGNLLCVSNGENLYNGAHEIIENGSNFYPNNVYNTGFPGIQGFMLLPFPGSINKVVHIYGDIKTLILPDENNLGYIKLLYAVVDMNQNAGLGKVVQRDLIAGTDTLIVGQLTATRHGNGRDWWIVAPHFRDQKFYRYLLSPSGLAKAGEQEIEAHDYGLGQTVFSPDGKWYARYLWHGIAPDSSFFSFDLYQFDRCSGLLSNRLTKTYDLSGLGGKPGGVAFSPVSRYLYVSRWDTIFQYDLQAPNIIASEQVVAGYDGFVDEQGRSTRFYSLQLAPDGKIYCCVSNNKSIYLHTIENPDSAGLACDVRQHSVQLPVFNYFLLPNMPYYRLWEWENSPCDTLGSTSVQQIWIEESLKVFPNPADQSVDIQWQEPAKADMQIELVSALGKLLDTRNLPPGSTDAMLSLEHYPSGLYFLLVSVAGRIQKTVKISVVK